MSKKLVSCFVATTEYPQLQDYGMKLESVAITTRDNSWVNFKIDENLKFSDIDECITYILHLLSANNYKVNYSFIFGGIMYDILFYNKITGEITKRIAHHFRKEYR